MSHTGGAENIGADGRRAGNRRRHRVAGRGQTAAEPVHRLGKPALGL